MILVERAADYLQIKNQELRHAFKSLAKIALLCSDFEEKKLILSAVLLWWEENIREVETYYMISIEDLINEETDLNNENVMQNIFREIEFRNQNLALDAFENAMAIEMDGACNIESTISPLELSLSRKELTTKLTFAFLSIGTANVTKRHETELKQYVKSQIC